MNSVLIVAVIGSGHTSTGFIVDLTGGLAFKEDARLTNENALIADF